MRAKITLLASLAIFLSFSSIFCINAWPFTIEVEVPNVVGYTQADAAAALTESSLSVGTVTLQSSSTIAAGEVIDQTPAARAGLVSHYFRRK
jgi:beta-lactam-binding protein with PASTA domain